MDRERREERLKKCSGRGLGGEGEGKMMMGKKSIARRGRWRVGCDWSGTITKQLERRRIIMMLIG